MLPCNFPQSNLGKMAIRAELWPLGLCVLYSTTAAREIANEGLVISQYKCLVPIYVFPELKLLFPKQNYNVPSPSSHTLISVRDFYASRIGLPFCCKEIFVN
jgi:hypothetical protein